MCALSSARTATSRTALAAIPTVCARRVRSATLIGMQYTPEQRHKISTVSAGKTVKTVVWEECDGGTEFTSRFMAELAR